MDLIIGTFFGDLGLTDLQWMIMNAVAIIGIVVTVAYQLLD
jgi:hypothetical protein